jgi:hypothetical protein
MNVAIALAALLAGPAAPPDPGAALARLSWMVGGWGAERDGEWSEEHWIAARGGTMLGVHRDVRGGRSTGFEFLRIEARPDGLVYLASPGGRPATEFRAVDVTGERVTFENPEHDFPQRILYWRTRDGLHARIEGRTGGKEASMEWRWPKLAP